MSKLIPIDLNHVHNLINLSGDRPLVEQLFNLYQANLPEVIEKSGTLYDVRRSARNLYKLLAFYPNIKQVTQIKVIEQPPTLRVSVHCKRETRGRKHKGA